MRKKKWLCCVRILRMKTTRINMSHLLCREMFNRHGKMLSITSFCCIKAQKQNKYAREPTCDVHVQNSASYSELCVQQIECILLMHGTYLLLHIHLTIFFTWLLIIIWMRQDEMKPKHGAEEVCIHRYSLYSSCSNSKLAKFLRAKFYTSPTSLMLLLSRHCNDFNTFITMTSAFFSIKSSSVLYSQLHTRLNSMENYLCVASEEKIMVLQNCQIENHFFFFRDNMESN